ncbi:MAG: hypothetical protein ABSD41_02635 [Candidatus Bathyarchaeia archaeon]
MEYSKGFKMAQNNGRRSLNFGRINVAKLQMNGIQGGNLGNLSIKMSDSVVSKACGTVRPYWMVAQFW